MRILANQPNNIVLLLVQPDGITPSNVDASSISVKYSVNCSSFAQYTGIVSSIGNGWHSISLNPGNAPNYAPIIITASAPGTLEWRDILEASNQPGVALLTAAQAGQWYLPVGRFGVIR